jgi:hypothetical protein
MNRLRRSIYGSLVVGLVVGGVTVQNAHAAGESPAAAPPAEGSIPSSLEVTAYVSPSLTFGEPISPERTSSFSRVGYFGELAVSYRSSYFVDPFFAVAYGPESPATFGVSGFAMGSASRSSPKISSSTAPPTRRRRPRSLISSALG